MLPKLNPYEFHVTVESVISDDEFRRRCQLIGVKPIILYNITRKGTLIKDWLTSHVVLAASDQEAIGFLSKFGDTIGAWGYKVIREKIEVPPMHPLIPTESNGLEVLSGNYFESHLEISVTPETLDKVFWRVSNFNRLQDDVGGRNHLHLSRNINKVRVDGSFDLMMTIRHTSPWDCIEKFKKSVDRVKAMFRGFVIKPAIIEYAIYDTNFAHDDSWTTT